MAAIYLAFQSVLSSRRVIQNTNKTWNDLPGIPQNLELLDETGASSGVTLVTSGDYIGFLNVVAGVDGGTTGDAAWVDEGAVVSDAYAVSGSSNITLTLSGLADSEQRVLEFYSNSNALARDIFASINGGTIQQVPDMAPDGVSENLTETLAVTATADSSGVITAVFTTNTGSNAYLTAARVLGVAPPSASVTTTDTLEPGKAITGTYANFTAAPTALSVTDAASNSISSASEITDLVIDDTAKTFAFTMPARITSGTGTTLLRGPVTLELT